MSLPSRMILSACAPEPFYRCSEDRLGRDCLGDPMSHREPLSFRQRPAKSRYHTDGVAAVTRGFSKIENQDRNDNEKKERFQFPRIVLAPEQRKPRAHEEKHPEDQRRDAEADRLRQISAVQRAARPLLPRSPPDREIARLHDLPFHFEAVAEQRSLLDFLDREMPDVGASGETGH